MKKPHVISYVRKHLRSGAIELVEGWQNPPDGARGPERAAWRAAVQLFRDYFILGFSTGQLAKRSGTTRQNISRRLLRMLARLEAAGYLRSGL